MCNSGVGLTPVVNGKVHHFAARGLYNGLSLLGDHETGSYWDHIRGECVYGPLTGHQLETFPLLHMNLRQALVAFPNVHLAVSNLSLRHRLMARIADWKRRSKGEWMPPFHSRTLGPEDQRRPRMELGLGVWTNTAHCFYPLERIRQLGGALPSEVDGRRLVVYIEPSSGVPDAFYSEAQQWRWENGALRLDTGETVWGGALYDAKGVPRALKRPMQMFTRWYGFALTFPGCEVYQET